MRARWSRDFTNGSSVRLQAYHDHSKRDDIVLFRPDAHIYDIEFQHGMALGVHDLVWGAGYRYAHDEVDPGYHTVFPSRRRLDWENVFVQDEIALKRTVALTAGVRLERNDYTGWEYLPTGRLAWKPSDQWVLWSSASRAVRPPSRLDREVFFPGTPPYLVVGGPRFESEVASVLELGCRAVPARATVLLDHRVLP